MIAAPEDVAPHLTVHPGLAGRRDAVLDLVRRMRVLLRGHFALQSGLHSPLLMRFAHLGRDRSSVDGVARHLLDLLPAVQHGTPTVLCPESAGLFLGDALARAIPGATLATVTIDSGRRPTSQLRSGAIPTDRPVVVVNDVVTTGASLEPLLRLATERRARVAGVLVFGTLDERRFHRFLSEKQLPGTWLVSANSWGLTEAARCTQCADATEVIEASEFN